MYATLSGRENETKIQSNFHDKFKRETATQIQTVMN